MPNDQAKAKRVLYVKIRTPSADATTLLATMMKNSAPLFKAFGDVTIRMLRNVDDKAQFLQVIEYQTDHAFELSRHKIASDPMMHNYVQACRTLFPGAIEIDVYEDVTESV